MIPSAPLLQRKLPMLLNGLDNHRKSPLAFGICTPHLTHDTYGPPDSSSQTASRSIQPFSYGSQMLCCTIHCQWEKKTPKIAHSPMEFITLPEQDGATTMGYMHKIW